MVHLLTITSHSVCTFVSGSVMSPLTITNLGWPRHLCLPHHFFHPAIDFLPFIKKNTFGFPLLLMDDVMVANKLKRQWVTVYQVSVGDAKLIEGAHASDTCRISYGYIYIWPYISELYMIIRILSLYIHSKVRSSRH